MSKRRNAAITILACCLLDSDDERNENRESKKRRVWRKDWLRLRESDGFCAKLMVELRAGEPELYRNFVRMTTEEFDHLLHLVKPYIARADTNMRSSIPAKDRLVLTLRYLATGDNFRSLQYMFRIPQTTISRIIPEVLDAIYKVLVDDFLKVPKTEAEWQAVSKSKQFEEKWHFPNCVGAIDGKHVVMVAPPNAGSIFYNYKGTHSIVLMAVADGEYKFMYVDVGRNGRFSDGGVFNRCTFGQALDKNELHLPPRKPLPGREMPIPYVFVADDAFAARPNVLKPYPQSKLTMVQRVFNYRLSRSRRIIENVLGIMSARFRVLRKPIHLNAEKTKKVTLACCVLHNYLMTKNRGLYAPHSSFDQYDDAGNLSTQADWRAEQTDATMFSLEPPRDSPVAGEPKEIQKEFATYFVEEGEIEFQYARI